MAKDLRSSVFKMMEQDMLKKKREETKNNLKGQKNKGLKPLYKPWNYSRLI